VRAGWKRDVLVLLTKCGGGGVGGGVGGGDGFMRGAAVQMPAELETVVEKAAVSFARRLALRGGTELAAAE